MLYCQTRSAHAWIGRERNDQASDGWDIVADCYAPHGGRNWWDVCEKTDMADGKSKVCLTAARAVEDYRTYLASNPVEFSRSKSGEIVANDDPSIYIHNLPAQQLLQLRDWIASNALQLELPEEIGRPDFLTSCLETIRENCGSGHYFDEAMCVDFLQRGGKLFEFIVPLGRNEQIIYPSQIGGRIGDYRKRRLTNCRFPDAPWVCSIWAEPEGGSNHYYPAYGGSPLDALIAACKLTRDPVRVSAAGHVYLGRSGDIQWRFCPDEVKWKHGHEFLKPRSFQDFEPYLRDQIWEKAQAHPKIANLILLDAALR